MDKYNLMSKKDLLWESVSLFVFHSIAITDSQSNSMLASGPANSNLHVTMNYQLHNTNSLCSFNITIPMQIPPLHY
jgi:hypothetical protein